MNFTLINLSYQLTSFQTTLSPTSTSQYPTEINPHEIYFNHMKVKKTQFYEYSNQKLLINLSPKSRQSIQRESPLMINICVFLIAKIYFNKKKGDKFMCWFSFLFVLGFVLLNGIFSFPSLEYPCMYLDLCHMFFLFLYSSFK